MNENEILDGLSGEQMQQLEAMAKNKRVRDCREKLEELLREYGCALRATPYIEGGVVKARMELEAL
jgi:hypothetical protein